MKKLLQKVALSLALTMFATTLPFAPFANKVIAKESKTSKIENKEAQKLFENLNKTNKKNRDLKNIDKNPILINEFEELNLLKIENKNDIDILYNTEDESIATIIAYNQNTNSNILLEANNKTGDIIIAINNKEYRLTQEGENIFAYSDNDNKIPVLITEYQSNINEISLPKKISNETRTTFGKNYGPFYKTNKVLVDILGAAGTIGGVAALKIKHPLLGIVSTVVGAISWVANLSYATLYIKYYQAFATNDPTYVRQTEYFYNYNNYTSLVKTRTWHFYSSRPY